MEIEVIYIALLWFSLYGYLIVASIDFGAGMYLYFGYTTNQHQTIATQIHNHLSPIWELSNIFFSIFFIGMLFFFPYATYHYSQVLLIPGGIALLLILYRGIFYFSGLTKRFVPVFTFIYSASGIFIPVLLSLALTISEGGFIEKSSGDWVINWDKLPMSLYALSVVVLAIVSVLFISATFLTYYAYQANDQQSLHQLQKYSLFWGIPTILASLFVFFSLQRHNSLHFEQMISSAWMFVASFLFFSIAMFLIFAKKYYGWAFLCVMLQYFFAFFGYGSTHLPYLLYPYITIYTNTYEQLSIEMKWIALGIIVFLFLPSLYLLFRHIVKQKKKGNN